MINFLNITLEDAGLLFFGDLFVTAIIFLIVSSLVFLLFDKYFHIRKRKRSQKILFFIFSILFIIRLFGIGQTDSMNIETVTIDFLLVVVLISFIYFLSGRPSKEKPDPVTSRIWLDVGIMCLLLIASLSTFSGLGEGSIFGDEIFQFEAAAGYINSGEFARWDFTLDQPVYNANGEAWIYDRAKTNTWLIAQSMRIFGISEFSSRLPAVIFSILFVLGAYLWLRIWLRDRLLSFLIALISIFSNTLISQGSVVRMYSFLLAVSGVAYLCWYKVVHHYLKKEYKRIIIPIIAGAFFTYLAIEAQSHLGLMMLVSIAVFIFSEWLFQFFKTRSLKDRVVMQLTSVVSLFLLTWAGITIYEYVFSASLVVLHYDFINFGHFSNSAYEMIGFFDFPILGVGMTLYILSIIVSYKKDMVHRFLAITSLFFLFSFIFVIDNNASARYLVIAIMLIIPSVGTALYDMLQGVVIKKNRYKLLFVFISFILLLVPLSIPKVSQQHVLSKAPSDHVKFYYDVAYDYIKKNRQSDDVIFGMPFRSYYWGPDKESNILRIRREYSEAYKDADQMAALMYKHKKGWIVWPNGYYNIDSDVVQYIVENATAHHGIEDDLKKAGFRVFYFDFTKREVPEDIAYLLMKKYGELAEGALVRDEDSRILLYTNNELHWIRSASIFSKCGYKRKNVIDSTSEELLDELNSIVLGDSIESEKQCGVLQEGDLVRGVEDRRLYLFQNSELRWITSTLVIEECNLDRFSVVDVLQNNIRQLPKGKSINKGEDCTLN